MQQVAELSRRFQLSPAVCSRAQEYHRLAEVRGVASLRGVSGPSLALVCLEIACSQCGARLDKKQAQKLSGLQPKAYTSVLHSVERVLNLTSHTSLRELAVQFSCLEAEHLANKILQNYRDKMAEAYTDSQREAVDTSKPLYSAASLYTACKKMKIRSDRTQFQAVAGCGSRAVFQRILDQMSKCVPTETSEAGKLGEAGKGKTKRKRKQKAQGTAEEEAEEGTEEKEEEEEEEDNGRKEEPQPLPPIRRGQRNPLSSRILSSPFSTEYLMWKAHTLATARAKLASDSQPH